MRVNFEKSRLKDDELELVAFDESGKKGTNWRGKDWGVGGKIEREITRRLFRAKIDF